MKQFQGLPALLARLAIVLGAIAVFRYAASGLMLAHYDAKAHLVVSRRILDSLTPGWEQIGAVWLPLPHLLNMVPVQVDHFYRTGAFAVAISVLASGLATASIAGVVLALTSSRAGAVLAAALYATNPNVLYLQSTPMTEPLLFGLTTFQVLLLTRWILSGQLAVPTAAGWVMVLACLTRYEAWPVTAASVVASAFAWWRRGRAPRDVWRVHARLAAYPIVTLLAFMAFSRVTVGEWFVSSGFFVPDDTVQGQPAVVFDKIVEGVTQIGGTWLWRLGAISALVLATLGLWSAGRSAALVPLALFAAAALPASAYLGGHPFRIRYQVPIVVACAVSTGLAVGLLRRVAPLVAVAVAAIVLAQSRPFDPQAQMILEARADLHALAREHVTTCLARRYRGGAVMASMGSLGHYMQEMSWAGFSIRDFLHEGNGPLWDSAFTRGPAPLVEWVLVEEVSEGGDAVVQRQRLLPRLLDDYDKLCSGGNVTLYRRRPR